MQFKVLTLFPDLFASPLTETIVGRAIRSGLIEVDLIDFRRFATDRHATADDRPFGGGEGMVLKPEPLARAVRHIRSSLSQPTKVILLSPQGRRFNQAMAADILAEGRVIMVCGRYEGIDQRFCDHYIDEEVSIGDFVLSGGELAALVIIDTVTRLTPGALGCPASACNDSFSRHLLKHPHYTRPRVFEGAAVPKALLSGNHELIKEFRFIASVKRTLLRRPDLLSDARFSNQECAWLKRNGLIHVIDAQQHLETQE